MLIFCLEFYLVSFIFFFQAEDGIRDGTETGVQTCALPIWAHQMVLPHFEVEAVIEALRRHERVSMFAAPTMLTRLVHAPALAAADLANLRTIFYGGGPMYVADLERALDLIGPRLYQLYGQGESPMTITGLDQRMHANV